MARGLAGLHISQGKVSMRRQASGKGGSYLSEVDPGSSLDDSSMIGDGKVGCGGLM